jgi:hypothetical protein
MTGININVTITSPDLHDAFLALAEAFLKMQGSSLPEQPQKPIEVQKPIEAQKTKVKAPEPAAPETTYTLEDVRKLSMEKSKKDKAAVKAAITAVGATKVTDIDTAKYPDYVALLEAI